MTIKASMAAAIALVRDTAACHEWEALCAYARALQRVSPHEVYMYQVNDLPWPVANRDVVVRIKWQRDDQAVVSMTATAVNGMVPPKPGMVRVQHAISQWTFEQLGAGQLKITTEAHIDPGGPIPAWIINMLLINSPVKSLSNLRRIVATGRYDGADLAFLDD